MLVLQSVMCKRSSQDGLLLSPFHHELSLLPSLPFSPKLFVLFLLGNGYKEGEAGGDGKCREGVGSRGVRGTWVGWGEVEEGMGVKRLEDKWGTSILSWVMFR